jgi:pimeloyl-ACP methyl ester carboxylesterase
MSTYVLVHGAWGGAHGWRKVRPLLRDAGHEVFTPSLTGLGERSHLARPGDNLSTHILDVTNAIWYEDLSDIVLIGHSYGGMVVTGVADKMPERIQHLVYLDAFLPANGQSLYDLAQNPNNTAPTPADDWRVAPLQRAQEDPWITARRQPQSRACFSEPVTLSVPLEERSFSLTYIVATERPDPSPQFDAVPERLRGNPRWTVRKTPGAHNMISTHPGELVDLLLELFPTKLAVSAT